MTVGTSYLKQLERHKARRHSKTKPPANKALKEEDDKVNASEKARTEKT